MNNKVISLALQMFLLLFFPFLSVFDMHQAVDGLQEQKRGNKR